MGGPLVPCIVALPGDIPGRPRVPVYVTREACFALREASRVEQAIQRQRDIEERQERARQQQEENRQRQEQNRQQREAEAAAKKAERDAQTGAQRDQQGQTADERRRAASPEGALDRIERTLLDVLPVHLRLQEGKPSQVVDFLQQSLGAMGYTSATATDQQGIAGRDFLADLNGYIAIKQREQGFQDLRPINDISELSGRHVQAIVDSLRDQGIMTGSTPSWLRELSQGLREIDNSELLKDANKLDPAGARMRTGAVLDTDNPIVVASTDTPTPTSGGGTPKV